MTKVELFSKDLQKISGVFKALGHPARLAILQYLAETRVCISGDISNEIPLSRTTVSQHLNELKEVNLIQGEIEGVKKNYCLNAKEISRIKDMLDSFLIKIECIDNQNCQ
ncbi:MAG: winged helix-turn-helix transcriptional regulator [Bacteroidales bacterium]|nr:winged helix-turn-helix transcriptional regulator [Bacteroidales bacterium]